jgi:hypothetical protein
MVFSTQRTASGVRAADKDKAGWKEEKEEEANGDAGTAVGESGPARAKAEAAKTKRKSRRGDSFMAGPS